MLQKIPLKLIKANPFNARKDYTDADIAELAKEIDQVGWWKGPLRGRKVDGKIELCFGHRRLAALKKLGWDEIEVDIQKLDDDEMAMQGLIENLQRRGLNDLEKANGIVVLVNQLSEKHGDKEKAYQRVSEMLGVGVQRIKDLAGAVKYEAPVKKAIQEGKISARVAATARSVGGPEMVETVIREGLSKTTIEKIGSAISKIVDEKTREKVRKQVATGKITDPKEIEKKAVQANTAKATKKNPPPDLLEVIIRWTDSIHDFTERLEQVAPYIDYIDAAPSIAKPFRIEVKKLIKALDKFQ